MAFLRVWVQAVTTSQIIDIIVTCQKCSSINASGSHKVQLIVKNVLIFVDLVHQNLYCHVQFSLDSQWYIYYYNTANLLECMPNRERSRSHLGLRLFSTMCLCSSRAIGSACRHGNNTNHMIFVFWTLVAIAAWRHSRDWDYQAGIQARKPRGNTGHALPASRYPRPDFLPVRAYPWPCCCYL